MSEQKFRPYFSQSELAEIIRCVKASSTNQSLLSYLEAFAIKIDRGVMQPQLTTAPSLESKLGLESSIKPNLPTPAKLHTIWLSSPDSLSPPQLSIVHTYRWENGFMDDEEASRFEESMFDGSATI